MPRIKRRIEPYLMITPALLIVIALTIYPLFTTVRYSFFNFYLNLPQLQYFAGFTNYLKLFTDARFFGSVYNTFFYIVASVGGGILWGLAVALALNKSFKGRGLARSCIIIPWAIPLVIVGIMWRYMYNDVFGIINAMLLKLGLISSPKIWLDIKLARLSLSIAYTWQTSPFIIMLLLAGLQGIPKELYESSQLDGANVFQRLFHITLPLLKPTILVAIIFRTFGTIKVFDIIYTLTGGGPLNKTESISLYAQRTLFGFLNFGYGSTISVVSILISASLAFLYVKLLR